MLNSSFLVQRLCSSSTYDASLWNCTLVPQLFVGTAWQRPLDDTARLFMDVAFSTVLVATLEVIAGGSCGVSREYQAAANRRSMFPDAGTHAIHATTSDRKTAVTGAVPVTHLSENKEEGRVGGTSCGPSVVMALSSVEKERRNQCPRTAAVNTTFGER